MTVELSIVVGGRVGPHELDSGPWAEGIAEKLQPGVVVTFRTDDGELHAAQVVTRARVAEARGQVVADVELIGAAWSRPPLEARP